MLLLPGVTNILIDIICILCLLSAIFLHIHLVSGQRRFAHAFIHGHRRTGRGGQGAAAPPIRAVCRHTFGQRVDIIRAKHNTCLNNTNLGSVTAVNGKILPPPPPPNRARKIWARKISATIPPPENFCYYPPPLNMHPGTTESIRAKLGLPPQMDVGPYAYVQYMVQSSMVFSIVA